MHLRDSTIQRDENEGCGRGGRDMPSMEEEKSAIREVLSEYCFHLDSGRFDDMARLFAADGTWATAYGKATGREAIAALGRKMRAGRPITPATRSVHLVTNFVIKLDGNRAHVLSNWMVAQNGPNGPIVSAAGGYEDDMVKQGGAWLIQTRTIDRFIAADLSPPRLA
ncbi:MAG: nuclear transport factor 2 family protein [Proteobacteria bacterium]|nr:nuclear transport factor 2 family protein [Pseudomonadota bacterium]